MIRASVDTKNEQLVATALFFLAFILMHAYSFLCLGLGFDEIQDFFGAWSPTYLAQDRWGHSAYRFFFGDGTPIWAGGIAAAVWLALAYWCQIRLFEITSRVEYVIFGALNILCAQFALMLDFMQHADAVAFSLFASSLGVMIYFKKQSPWRTLLALLLLALAISCYQTILFFATILILVRYWIEAQALRFPFSIKRVITLSSLLLGSVIIWYTINAVCKAYAPQWALDYARDYHASRSQLSLFVQLGFTAKLFYLAHYTKLALLSACGGLEDGRWIYSSALLPLTYLMYHAWRTWRGITRLIGLALPLAVWVLPFVLVIILGTLQPARTFLAEPLALASLWLLAWRAAPASLTQMLIVRRLTIALLSLLFIQSFYRISTRERYDIARYEELKLMLQQLESYRLSLSMQQARELSVSIALYDANGEPDTMTPLTGIAKHHGMKHLSTQLTDQAKQRLNQMPSWPAVGSTITQGDRLIIRYDIKSRDQSLQL